MSGTRISDLPPITSPQSGDEYPVVQSGVTYKVTNAQLSTFFASGVTEQGIQDQSYIYAVAANVSNAYTASISPTPSSYVNGLRVALLIPANNTGSSTLNLNSLGAVNILTMKGDSLLARNLKSGIVQTFTYYNGNFYLETTSNAVTSPIFVQNQDYIYDGAATNVGNDYEMTIDPPIAINNDGLRVALRVPADNTGASTLNINGLGTGDILTLQGTALSAGNMKANRMQYISYYNGAYYLDNSANGCTDITIVGTLTTGTWNATTIATGYGGTGTTTPKTIFRTIDVTAATMMLTNYRNFANNAADFFVELPTTSAYGDVMEMIGGINTGKWEIKQNAGQYIKFGSTATTTGTGGSILSQHVNDCIKLVCIEANLGWIVVSSVGNFTVN